MPVLAPDTHRSVVLAAALAAGLVAACSPSAGGEVIDLTRTEANPSHTPEYNAEGAILRLAVAPVYSPLTTLDMHRALADYLGAHLGRQAELVQGKTYSEINDLIRAGGVTLAIVCTNAYLEGQEDFGLESLAVPQIGGRTVYYSYLIVPTDASARSLADLRGTTFAFSDPLSNSGRLAPLYHLLQMGETPDAFFRRTIFTYSHDNSVRAVMDGLTDGAAVDSLVYDYMAARDPDVHAKTRIIARWGPYGINPVVVHPQTDPVTKERLQSVLLHMHQDAEGRDILASLGVERFRLPESANYESVRLMRNRVRQQQ